MPELNLETDYLTQVKAILKQYAPKHDVWVFGSRINKTCHESSDLDIVIRNPGELLTPLHNLAELKQAFIDSNIPILIDVMDWASLPDSYRNQIEQHYYILL